MGSLNGFKLKASYFVHGFVAKLAGALGRFANFPFVGAGVASVPYITRFFLELVHVFSSSSIIMLIGAAINELLRMKGYQFLTFGQKTPDFFSWAGWYADFLFTYPPFLGMGYMLSHNPAAILSVAFLSMATVIFGVLAAVTFLTAGATGSFIGTTILTFVFMGLALWSKRNRKTTLFEKYSVSSNFINNTSGLSTLDVPPGFRRVTAFLSKDELLRATKAVGKRSVFLLFVIILIGGLITAAINGPTKTPTSIKRGQ